MPFQRRWDEQSQEWVIDRDLTGPPPPPSTGTIKAEDGSIVADSTTVSIPPATPVTVDQPSPFEPVIDANRKITPRWWRFFDQLYRRTGGVVDNINRVPATLLGSGGTVAMTITGAAPSLSWTQAMGAPANMTITGAAPSLLLRMPAAGSMGITGGDAPTVTSS